MNIKPTKREDFPGIKHILSGIDLFPPEALEDMYDASVSVSEQPIWLTAKDEAGVIGFCYARPEPLTVGSWNMLAIGVLSKRQGLGVGGVLTQALEDGLRQQGVRLLIVDTSGTETYDRTRTFYRKHGYEEAARIRDFWDIGDDKITFRKVL